jgi:phosphotransferase system enzyme I (PtsP)
MLYSEVLEEISGELPLFENSSDRDSFLKETVGKIKGAINADMAAVFIQDDGKGDLVLRAGVDSDGVWDHLNCPECTDTDEPFRFSFDQNDAGRAFNEGRVIRRTYPSGDAEHGFRSKIIVPLARGPMRLGVLILADSREDAFDELDDGEILSSSSRLADLIEDASVLISHEVKANGTRIIQGRKAGSGIALGRALPFWADMETAARTISPVSSTEEELARFDRSLERSIHQLKEIRQKAEEGVSETGAMIFMAQILMLRDESFTGMMRETIENGEPATTAIRRVVTEYADRFSQMAEERLAEKSQDVRDLGYRMITNLASGESQEFSYEGRIALARHIYPSDLFRLSLEGISGVVLMGAAATAHISILAGSLGLPVLITEDKALLGIPDGTQLILDAEGHRLYVEPAEDLLEEYRRKLSLVSPSPDYYTLKGATADGTAVKVMANVNILKDAEEARRQGAEGIGLYRSEFPFILKNDILSEEQQYKVYRSVVETQKGKPVVLRTADIGGDKILQGREDQESNPFLGVRGIRFSLAHKEMFRDQLRAMLRAGVNADLGIMLPMVSGVEEVLEAREQIEKAASDLHQRGVAYNPHPRIGAMVEIPSAALAVPELASHVDFLSIGTNDLTMYLLAVDRTNENLSHLYSSRHPTILRAINHIVRGANRSGTKVSVCGDAAADPVLTPFFIGIGIRELSVSPHTVESLKKRLAAINLEDAETIAKEMLAIGRIDEMETYLKENTELLALGELTIR